MSNPDLYHCRLRQMALNSVLRLLILSSIMVYWWLWPDTSVVHRRLFDVVVQSRLPETRTYPCLTQL